MTSQSGKRNEAGLGKSLVKKQKKKSHMHNSEKEQGGNFSSIAISEQESQIQEFLSLAELAGTTFTAEKLQSSSIVSPDVPLPHNSTTNTSMIQPNSIPRRPLWDKVTTKEEFHENEEKVLLEWQKQIGAFESIESVACERNIHIWRQLWSVIDKSDIVVQIVDARNPLLFRCKDLEKYVTEVDSCKLNMILMSKSDLLNDKQRKLWLEYFKAESMPVAFWSSKLAGKIKLNEHSIKIDEDCHFNEVDDDVIITTDSTDASLQLGCQCIDGEDSSDDDTVPTLVITENFNIFDHHLKSNNELLKFFRELFLRNHHDHDKATSGQLMTVGMVGYPNVGKSSTINTLLKKKVVPVSNTPGKTKHLQTILVDKDILLCDCPGLVFPNPLSTKAEMFCHGILPIDQLKDYRTPISWICSRLPREVLEDVYGIILPLPREGESPTRPPTSDELLCSYGRSRGYMITKGVPDQARSARHVLRDFITGSKLLYCEPPPGVDAIEFNSHLHVVKADHHNPVKKSISEFDENYFTRPSLEKVKAVYVNSEVATTKMSSSIKSSGKKHNNKYKRKKL